MFVPTTKFCLYGSRRLKFIANLSSQLLNSNQCLHNVQKSIFMQLENRLLYCSARGNFLASCNVKSRSVIFHTPNICTFKTVQKCFPSCSSLVSRSYSSNELKGNEPEQPEKQSLIKRFKQMYKDYWYVLLPVHVVTSIFWFGGFYYLAKRDLTTCAQAGKWNEEGGVDVVALLESMGFSEKITNHLKDTNAGYVALAYALYKIATPVRYTVTLGGTTISIKYLKEWGYIKPIQSPAQLKKMYTDKKDQFREKAQSFKSMMKRDSEREACSKKKSSENLEGKN